MARICVCVGTTTGTCVAVVTHPTTYTPPTGYFVPPDDTGNVGDTWSGSAWTRVADPSADADATSEWRVNRDTGELHAVVGSSTVWRVDAQGRIVQGHSAALASGLVEIHRGGGDPLLALLGYGDTPGTIAALLMGRSKGAVGVLDTLDDAYVLGRIDAAGVIHDDTLQIAGRQEWVRASGGNTVESGALRAYWRLMVQPGSLPGLVEAMRVDADGQVGIGRAPAARLQVDRVGGTAPLQAWSSGGDVLSLIDAAGRVVAGATESYALDGEEPMLQAHGGLAHVGKWGDDAAPATLTLLKSRGVLGVTGESDVLTDADAVGAVSFKGLTAENAFSEFARIEAVADYDSTTPRGRLEFSTLDAAGATTLGAVLDHAGRLGVGTAEPEARLHAYSSSDDPSALQLVAVFEAAVDDQDPETNDDPDAGHGVWATFVARAAGGGRVNAGQIFTVATDVTAGADAHELRFLARYGGASAGPVSLAGTGAGTASWRVPNGTAAAPGLAFYGDTDTGIYRSDINELGFVTGGTDRARIAGSYFRPTADNVIALGGASNRWSTVYAATGTINTSDSREKVDLGALPLGLDFIAALTPRWFRWLDGSRHHAGLYAQDVAAALTAAGIDPATAGMWTLADAADPGSRQGLRMDQFIAPLIMAVQQLAARVAALEAT